MKIFKVLRGGENAFTSDSIFTFNSNSFKSSKTLLGRIDWRFGIKIGNFIFEFEFVKRFKRFGQSL